MSGVPEELKETLSGIKKGKSADERNWCWPGNQSETFCLMVIPLCAQRKIVKECNLPVLEKI